MKISYEWLGEAPAKRPTCITIDGIECYAYVHRAACRTGSPVRRRFSGFGPKSAPNHRDFGPEKVGD